MGGSLLPEDVGKRMRRPQFFSCDKAYIFAAFRRRSCWDKRFHFGAQATRCCLIVWTVSGWLIEALAERFFESRSIIFFFGGSTASKWQNERSSFVSAGISAVQSPQSLEGQQAREGAQYKYNPVANENKCLFLRRKSKDILPKKSPLDSRFQKEVNRWRKPSLNATLSWRPP